MNDDRDPRIFFAAERTLLAWIRTAIAMMGLGFVVARFGVFLRMAAAATRNGEPPQAHWESTVLGVAFVLLGVVTLFVAAWQHARFCEELGEADLPQTYFPRYSLWFTWILALLGVALSGWLVWSTN
jgi:putative membrane protein